MLGEITLPSSIDDLFGNLDEDLRQENYSIWRKRVGHYLNAQFMKYNLIIGQTERNLKRKIPQDLKKKFESLRYLTLGRTNETQFSTKNDFERSRLAGNISLILFEQGSDTLEMAKKCLEKYIDNLRESIKFDNLLGADIIRMSKVLSKDIRSMVYDYFTNNLSNYYENLRNFLRNLEELNQIAEKSYNHSELYPGRFARRNAKDRWKLELQTLLKSLEQKYSSVQSSYGLVRKMYLTEYGGVGVLFPTLINNIKELRGIRDELKARDPKSEINIKKEGDRTYIISMKSMEEYKMDNPSLKLVGEYEKEPGKTERIDIDLTKGVKGDICSSEVIYGGEGLIKKLQLKLTINLPPDFQLKYLKVICSYELPCLAETKTIEKLLTTNVVKLV